MEADAFVAALVRWAEPREDVGAVLLVGSQARTEEPADQWSDVDVVLFVEEPARYLDDAGWVEAFGRPLLTFLERAPVGDAIERRVLYDDGLDVDFVVFPSAALERAAADPETAAVLGRGYRVLVDRVGLTELAARAAAGEPAPHVPSKDELDALAADFWHHGVWAARKLARGELLVAKRSTDLLPEGAPADPPHMARAGRRLESGHVARGSLLRALGRPGRRRGASGDLRTLRPGRRAPGAASDDRRLRALRAGDPRVAGPGAPVRPQACAGARPEGARGPA